jgi:hypothetical protein
VSGFSEEDGEAVIDRLEAKYQAVAEGDAERLCFSRRVERDLEDIADCIAQSNPGTGQSGTDGFESAGDAENIAVLCSRFPNPRCFALNLGLACRRAFLATT